MKQLISREPTPHCKFKSFLHSFITNKMCQVSLLTISGNYVYSLTLNVALSDHKMLLKRFFLPNQNYLRKLYTDVRVPIKQLLRIILSQRSFSKLCLLCTWLVYLPLLPVLLNSWGFFQS